MTQFGARLGFGLAHNVHACQSRLERLQAALSGLDPQGVLARGYSITLDAQGKVITDSAQARDGERLRTTLARGWLESELKQKG